MGFELPRSLIPSPPSPEYGDYSSHVTETEAAFVKPAGGRPSELPGNLFHQAN